MPGGRNDTCWQKPSTSPRLCCTARRQMLVRHSYGGRATAAAHAVKEIFAILHRIPPAARSLLSAVGGFPSSLSSVFCASPLVARPADPTRHHPHKPELAKLPSARRRKLATVCRPRQERENK